MDPDSVKLLADAIDGLGNGIGSWIFVGLIVAAWIRS